MVSLQSLVYKTNVFYKLLEYLVVKHFVFQGAYGGEEEQEDSEVGD